MGMTDSVKRNMSAMPRCCPLCSAPCCPARGDCGAFAAIKYAYMRKISAAINALTCEKQTPVKPDHLAGKNATKQRATISTTPAIMAKVE